MEKVISLDNEELELELEDCSDLKITLDNSASLNLRLVSFSGEKNVKITAEVGSNSVLNVTYADFSKGNVNVLSNVNLVKEGAKCDWHLATLSNRDTVKTFDISFNHLVGKTVASMDNYGVAKDNSKIVFTGVNHIFNGAKGSDTKQNAKIIVFDERAQGVASPALRIDENDVKASHGAVVGQLNNEHMFYLMSRGLSRDEARNIITLGYLDPISRKFSDKLREKIADTIRGLI